MEPNRQATPGPEVFAKLAAGAAHDLSNVISGILIQLGPMRHHVPENGTNAETLGQIEREAVRAANLTRQVILFSGQEPARTESVDMNGLSQGLLGSLRRMLAENIDLQFQGDANQSWVKGDAGYLEQLIVNLCLSAQNALPNGGRIDLRVSERTLDDEGHDPNSARYVCVEVSCESSKVDPVCWNHLAKHVNSRDESGRGTPWRLAAVCAIADQHKGWMETRSSPVSGSFLRAYLPGGPGPSTVRQETEDSSTVQGGSETILLVDDVLSLRRSVAMCLRKLGYAVFEAGDTEEARKVWAERRETIDLLLTDLSMMDLMGGLDLARDFRRDRGTLKVIILSGEVAGSRLLRSLAESGFSYLPKPCEYAALGKSVRACLDGRRII